MSTSSIGLQGVSAPPAEVVVQRSQPSAQPSQRQYVQVAQARPPAAQATSGFAEYIRPPANIGKFCEEKLDWKGFSFKTFSKDTVAENFVAFRATESWKTPNAMFCGETPFKRGAMLRSVEIHVFQDQQGRKPLVVCKDVLPEKIKKSCQERIKFYEEDVENMQPAKWSEDGEEQALCAAFDNLIPHVFTTTSKNLQACVDSIDVENAPLREAVQQAKAQSDNSRWPIDKFILELPRLHSSRDVPKGCSLIPLALITEDVFRMRACINLSKENRVDAIMTTLLSTPDLEVLHVHRAGYNIRVITAKPITHDWMNKVKILTSCKTIFSDDLIPGPAPDQVSDRDSTVGPESESEGRKQRFILTTVNGGIVPPPLLQLCLAKFRMTVIQFKKQDFTRYILEATKNTPLDLQDTTRLGAKLSLTRETDTRASLVRPGL